MIKRTKKQESNRESKYKKEQVLIAEQFPSNVEERVQVKTVEERRF